MNDEITPASSGAARHAPEQRLDELEIKISYLDDLLEQLNLTLYQQQRQIETLQQQVDHLRKQLPENSASQGNVPRDALDERPPHY